MPGPMGGPMGPRGFLTDEEKQNVPKVTGSLIKRILSYLKPYWLQFLLVFVTILVSAGVGLLPSIITGRIVNEALVGKNMKLLVQLLIAAFVTLTASQVIGVLESYINAWISNKIIYDMKNQMYGHLLSMPHAFFTAIVGTEFLSRFVIVFKTSCILRIVIRLSVFHDSRAEVHSLVLVWKMRPRISNPQRIIRINYIVQSCICPYGMYVKSIVCLLLQLPQRTSIRHLVQLTFIIVCLFHEAEHSEHINPFMTIVQTELLIYASIARLSQHKFFIHTQPLTLPAHCFYLHHCNNRGIILRSWIGYQRNGSYVLRLQLTQFRIILYQPSVYIEYRLTVSK